LSSKPLNMLLNLVIKLPKKDQSIDIQYNRQEFRPVLKLTNFRIC
jgi:hypothetical protein